MGLWEITLVFPLSFIQQIFIKCLSDRSHINVLPKIAKVTTHRVELTYFYGAGVRGWEMCPEQPSGKMNKIIWERRIQKSCKQMCDGGVCRGLVKGWLTLDSEEQPYWGVTFSETLFWEIFYLAFTRMAFPKTCFVFFFPVEHTKASPLPVGKDASGGWEATKPCFGQLMFLSNVMSTH